MRIEPISPIACIRNPPRQNKAGIIVHAEVHIVLNYETGERITLPPREAWALYQSLNMVDIII